MGLQYQCDKQSLRRANGDVFYNTTPFCKSLLLQRKLQLHQASGIVFVFVDWYTFDCMVVFVTRYAARFAKSFMERTSLEFPVGDGWNNTPHMGIQLMIDQSTQQLSIVHLKL